MDKQKSLLAFSALSQETRLDVFRLLIQVGPEGLPAGEISARLNTLQNTLSTHLTLLSRASLVGSVREGRNIRYFANMDGVKGLLEFLMEDCCGGKTELCQPVIEKIVCLC